MSTILCLLCLCENREYPGIFQNKLIKQNKAPLSDECPIIFCSQSERRRETSLEWKSIDLPSKLSLTYGVMLTIEKAFIILFLIVGNFQNKLVSSSFNWVSSYILFLAKLKGRGRPFLEGARTGVTLWDYPSKSTWLS